MKKMSAIVLLAGLAPLPAAAQLPPVDAGTILNQIQNSQNQFPQVPPPVTIDTCVFTEFRNNKCIFKCESGAVLSEPAVKPDFSSGEPAGACATHIFRPVRPSPAFYKQLTSSQLEDLLEDPNPEVRLAAVKSAKKYILNSFAQEPVLDIFRNGRERADIRVEAARTLSYASGYYKVTDAFRDLLRYSNGEPRELRVMTYKALFQAAAHNSSYQDFLTDAVKYSEKDKAARLAAVWALFDSSQNSRPQDLLIDLVKYGGEEEAVRIEALKSLYGAMGHYRVKDLALDTAKSGSEPKAVRLAAIKALSAANGDSSVRSFLDDTMRREQDPQLRAAAIWAAAPDLMEVREYFHLGYLLQNGGYVSPIERE